jgi:hypothetical protein
MLERYRHSERGVGRQPRNLDRNRQRKGYLFGGEIPHSATSFANDVAPSDSARDDELKNYASKSAK